MTGLGRWKQRVLRPGFGLLGIALCLVGCAAVHPDTPLGTGRYSYATGTLSWTYPLTIDRLWPETVAEAKALQLQIVEETMDGLGGVLKTKRADGVEITFTLQPVSTDSTDLSIRIKEHAAHRHEAEHIHARIRRRLGLER